ncbi:hypothetical protein [Streptomyces sp. NPDC001389]|uniref:hypothetical protein n=1 Tax=Streptomyces sp. NPDC001389 TaxID=3364569 RepID=UPI0036AC8B25
MSMDMGKPSTAGQAPGTEEPPDVGVRAPAAEDRHRLTALQGLAALSLDAMASVAYGPESIVLVLAAAGAYGLGFTLPVTVAIAALPAVLVASYRQVIAAFPDGGGSYAVAKRHLGRRTSLVAAASLMGVFGGFTLCQVGMVRHWYGERPRGWRAKAALNGFVPVSGLSRLTSQALTAARSLGDEVLAVTVTHPAPEDRAVAEALRRDWELWQPGVELIELASDTRALGRPLSAYVRKPAQTHQDAQVTVLIPETEPARLRPRPAAPQPRRLRPGRARPAVRRDQAHRPSGLPHPRPGLSPG